MSHYLTPAPGNHVTFAPSSPERNQPMKVFACVCIIFASIVFVAATLPRTDTSADTTEHVGSGDGGALPQLVQPSAEATPLERNVNRTKAYNLLAVCLLVRAPYFIGNVNGLAGPSGCRWELTQWLSTCDAMESQQNCSGQVQVMLLEAMIRARSERDYPSGP